MRRIRALERRAYRAARKYVAGETREEALDAVGRLAAHGIAASDISGDFCRRQLATIVEALPPGRLIQVGAEDSSRTDAVLDVVTALAAEGVAQARGVTGTG